MEKSGELTIVHWQDFERRMYDTEDFECSDVLEFIMGEKALERVG